jgi:predicted nucleic acid-binding protein
MPDKVFLDSNVLIYAVGDDDARRDVADSLIAAGPVISAQVLAETAAVLRRKFQVPPASVTKILQTVLDRVQCVPLNETIVLAALQVGERLGYAHYDGQIIAAALAAGCDVLYSEDLQHGQVIDGKLTIINPFAP